MLGTIVNTCTILLGSIIGSIIHRGINEKYQEVLFTAMGLAAFGIGINSICQNMPKSEYPVLFIVSLAVGGLMGTALDLQGKVLHLHFSHLGKFSIQMSPPLANLLSKPKENLLSAPHIHLDITIH